MGSAEGISTAAPCLHMLTTHRLTAIVRRNARVPLDARCSMSIDRRSFVATAAALGSPRRARRFPDCHRARVQFARLVNATADEIGLLFSTAEGENVIAQGLDLVAGDNVVVDELHYPTEFVLYRALEAARGVELRIAKHRAGMVDASDFAPLVDRRTRIVSVAWVSHQNAFVTTCVPSRTWRMPMARCSTPTPSRRSGCSRSTCRRRE